MRKLLTMSSVLFPSVIGRVVFNLSFKTRRKSFSESDLFSKDSVIRKTVDLGNDGHAVVYKWGTTGPLALIVHGWNGQARQFEGTIRFLLARGYRVVAFDAPGHGLSSGDKSDLPTIVKSLEAVRRNFALGSIELLIGHSLGGLAIGRFIANGGEAKNVLLIATPKSIKSVMDINLNPLNLSMRSLRVFMKLFVAKYGHDVWQKYNFDLFSDSFLGTDNVKILHDKNDNLVPFDDGEHISGMLKGSSLITSTSLGHRMILNSQEMFQAIESF